MTELELLQYADYLFEQALCRTENFEDAQDIVQETLIAGLEAVKTGVEVQNPKSFLSGILNHKFTDTLRLKYSKPVVYYGYLPEFQNDEKSASQMIIEKEDREKIRKCLAELSKIYREVMVMHFIHRKSVKQISEELGINENTVKSRLNSARQSVKQRMEKLDMEKFESKSYEPERLNMWVFGSMEENSPFNISDDRHLIHQNILLLAYEKPVTITEISDALGISAAFIEPIVEELIEDDFMKRVSDKVVTDFIIYSDEDIKRIAEKDKAVAKSIYADVWGDMEKYFDEIRQQDFFEKYSKGQKEAFLHFNAVFILHEAARSVKTVKIGNVDNQIFHKSGWTGYAYGKSSYYNAVTDWTDKGYKIFQVNGPNSTQLIDYKNIKNIMSLCYELNTGRTFSTYWPVSETSLLKILYALYSEEESDIPVIDQRFFQNGVIDKLIAANIIRKAQCKPVFPEKYADRVENSIESSQIVLNIPVLEPDAWEWWNSFLDKTIQSFTEKYSDEIGKLFEECVKIPDHLKGLPEVIKYQENGTYFPMAVIFYAQWNGFYLTARNFQKNPIPAMVLMIGRENT